MPYQNELHMDAETSARESDESKIADGPKNKSDKDADIESCIGLPKKDEILSETKSIDELTDPETETTFNSVYKNESHEIEETANSAKLQSAEPEVENEEELNQLKKSPHIPSDIFPNLPEILATGCSAFDDSREKDVFLTSSLVILSGCMPNVSGVYAQQTIYPNLFSFIIAPPASGKGVMRFSKMLGDKVHSEILAKSKQEKEDYDIDKITYDQNLRSKKANISIMGPPRKPPFRVLYIPANTSYAKFLSHLMQNDGKGIVFETEADTMANVQKQDWGSYSDIVRKSFHHERLSSSKRTDNEFIEIENPKLSMALSGTPSQVRGLINSTEDGLFSRIIFYVFESDPIWHNVSPNINGVNLTDFFSGLSEKVLKLYNYFNDTSLEVQLTDYQWVRLNESFSSLLIKVTAFNGNDSASVVKRLGMIMFRIIMILTALRKFESGDDSHTIICSDQDFEIAEKLCNIYLDHSILMFNNLPRQEKTVLFKSGNNKQKFFDELPPRFKRSVAVELGKKQGMSERTVDGLLKRLLGKYLQLESYGIYIKTEVKS